MDILGQLLVTLAATERLLTDARLLDAIDRKGLSKRTRIFSRSLVKPTESVSLINVLYCIIPHLLARSSAPSSPPRSTEARIVWNSLAGRETKKWSSYGSMVVMPRRARLPWTHRTAVAFHAPRSISRFRFFHPRNSRFRAVKSGCLAG